MWDEREQRASGVEGRVAAHSPPCRAPHAESVTQSVNIGYQEFAFSQHDFYSIRGLALVLLLGRWWMWGGVRVLGFAHSAPVVFSFVVAAAALSSPAPSPAAAAAPGGAS